jgi:hypothetical protein
MLGIIMSAALATVSPAPRTTAQVQTCVWPNRCASRPVVVAQVFPCVWPNRCQATKSA